MHSIKLIARLILKRKISGSHTIPDQSLLLSTIVLNDKSYILGVQVLKKVTEAYLIVLQALVNKSIKHGKAAVNTFENNGIDSMYYKVHDVIKAHTK